MWLSVQMPGLTKLFQKRFNPSNERRVAHYEKPLKKKKNRGGWGNPGFSTSKCFLGLRRFCKTNHHQHETWTRLLKTFVSFQLHLFQFSFHSLVLFLLPAFDLLFYTAQKSWVVCVKRAIVSLMRESLLVQKKKKRLQSKKQGLRLDWESVCTVINVLLCFVKDAWPFQYYISGSDENGIWNIIVKNGLIGIIMTKRLSMQKTQQDPIVKELDTESAS